MFLSKSLVPLIAGAILLLTATIPAIAATDVELFAQQPTITNASLSPDGQRVAFLSSAEGRYHLVIEMIVPPYTRAVVGPGPQLDFRWLHWANNDRLVLSASYSGRRERRVETTETRLFSVAANGQDLQGIIRPARASKVGTRMKHDLLPPQIQDKIVDWLPHEPNHILVAVDSDFNNRDEVRRVDIRNGKYKIELGEFTLRRTWIADQTGRIRLGYGYDQGNVAVTITDDNDKWTDHTGEIWMRQGFVPILFTEDPNVILVMGPNDDGLWVVRKLRLDTGEFIESVFEHESVDAYGIVTDDSSGRPIGVRYTEHLPAVDYFDETFRKLKATIDRAMADTTNRIISTSANQRQVLIFARSDTNPGSYFVWDRDAKSLSHYRDSMPGLAEDMLSPVKPVSYEARDGWDIPAYLTFPLGVEGSNLPAVILPHGGPRVRDDKQYWFLSQFLAFKGYVVLQPNFRGSDGYGDTFADAGLSEWGGKMQDDVTDGTQWLIEQGIADPDRVCIVGWSYGGYAAGMGAASTPSLFQCAASINGVLDLPMQIREDKQYLGGSEWTKHVGLEGEKTKAVSPYHLAENIVAPMLIIQSEDDARVHKEQGRRMAKRLDNLDKTVDYVEIEFGGHSMRNVDGRTKILEALDAFLERNIGVPESKQGGEPTP